MLLADKQYLKEERMQAMLVNFIPKNFKEKKKEETNLILSPLSSFV